MARSNDYDLFVLNSERHRGRRGLDQHPERDAGSLRAASAGATRRSASSIVDLPAARRASSTWPTSRGQLGVRNRRLDARPFRAARRDAFGVAATPPQPLRRRPVPGRRSLSSEQVETLQLRRPAPVSSSTRTARPITPGNFSSTGRPVPSAARDHGGRRRHLRPAPGFDPSLSGLRRPRRTRAPSRRSSSPPTGADRHPDQHHPDVDGDRHRGGRRRSGQRHRHPRRLCGVSSGDSHAEVLLRSATRPSPKTEATAMASSSGDNSAARSTVQLQNENVTLAATADSAETPTYGDAGRDDRRRFCLYAEPSPRGICNNMTPFQIFLCTRGCPTRHHLDARPRPPPGLSLQANHFLIRAGARRAGQSPPPLHTYGTRDRAGVTSAMVPNRCSEIGTVLREPRGAEELPRNLRLGTRWFHLTTRPTRSARRARRAVPPPRRQISCSANESFGLPPDSICPSIRAVCQRTGSQILVPSGDGASSPSPCRGATFRRRLVNEIYSGGGIGDGYTRRWTASACPA